MKRVRITVMAAALLGCAGVLAKPDPNEPCIAGASQFHHVNPQVLTAILRVEGMGDTQVVRNTNGTVDVGRGGINSVHFAELSRWGVAPDALMNGCINTYVAAWLVRRNLQRYGNTWSGYAAYHSKTPSHNVRYQILIANELVRMGVLPGPIQPVPPREVSRVQSISWSTGGR
jgi:hypothetical protein